MKIYYLLASLLVVGSAVADWKPVEGKMLTPWGSKLDPTDVWTEYPRPQLQRKNWTNLSGLWSFAVAGKDAGTPERWDDEILVPFCPESSLSGVGRLIEPDETMWYRRSLPTKVVEGQRTLIHFEAVDHEAVVWVNGEEVGRHVGGHTPFSFDITSALDADGENELVVRAYDATEAFQLRGKQALKPYGITATRVSGIWQTVWLEQVPERRIDDLGYDVDFDRGEAAPGGGIVAVRVEVNPTLVGEPLNGETVRITVSLDGEEIAAGEGAGRIALEIPEAKLWSPDSPTLYDVTAEILDGEGKTVDAVSSYTGLRKVTKQPDARGNPRIFLNGKEIFLLGPLDQGWWPDGLLTPPSDEAMLADLKFIKSAGFNMIRKHVKVEPSRYYWHCDRLGLVVWQDQVNAGLGPKSEPAGISPSWTRMGSNPKDAVWSDENHRQWVTEYKAMVDHLRDHPSILIWSPFNEAWGQHRSMEIGRMAMEYDPGRLVCHASGGNFWPVGHIASAHHYPNPRFPLDDARFRDYIKVVGEMGGYGWAVEGHLWNPEAENWGYRLQKSLHEWKAAYRRTMDELMPLRESAVSAAVYTQTSDFETEVNGLMTYDRVPKVDPSWLKPINERVIEGRGARRGPRREGRVREQPPGAGK